MLRLVESPLAKCHVGDSLSCTSMFLLKTVYKHLQIDNASTLSGYAGATISQKSKRSAKVVNSLQASEEKAFNVHM